MNCQSGFAALIDLCYCVRLIWYSVTLTLLKPQEEVSISSVRHFLCLPMYHSAGATDQFMHTHCWWGWHSSPQMHWSNEYKINTKQWIQL